ncbi:MAG: ABC transporter permease [Oscillospiraceae bacterium]|nr:ABC transporter permease [Oscillospiraceae bacterium]
MKSRKPFYPYLVWMIFFTVIPLGMVLYYSFTDDAGAFSFDNLKYLTNPYIVRVYIDSLRMAFITTVICLVAGYPFAYIISKMSVNKQRTMNMLIMLPMWMNFLLRIYAWMTLLESNGIINNILVYFGLERQQLINNDGAVITVMIYNFLPFMIIPIYTVMSKIDKSLIEAGQDLGCNGYNIFKRIVFPLSIPGVITGITMVFVPAASTFVISQRLGNGMMIGDAIEQYYVGSSPNINMGSMLSLVLMIIIVISMAIMNRFDKGEDAILI